MFEIQKRGVTMHAPLFGYEPGTDSGIDEMVRRAAAETGGLPETIILELPKPVLLIKYSAEGDYHTLELWVIPDGEEFEKLLDARVASKLLLTFEGGLEETRSECRTFIDRHYPRRPEVWMPKELTIEAVEQD